MQNCRPGQREKKFQGCHIADMSFYINDDENLSLILSGLQNLGFLKSTKNSCDLWKQCGNLSKNFKMVAITQIETCVSRWSR